MFMVIMEVDILNDDSLGKFVMSTYLSNGYTLLFSSEKVSCDWTL